MQTAFAKNYYFSSDFSGIPVDLEKSEIRIGNQILFLFEKYVLKTFSSTGELYILAAVLSGLLDTEPEIQ